MFRQCKLRNGTRYKYAWIPSKYAKIGKVLKIRGIDGWVVEEIYGTETEKNLLERERGYKRWRKQTDV